MEINPKCQARHIGPWAIEANYFRSAWAAVQAGTYPQVDAMQAAEDFAVPTVTDEGILVLDLVGGITKGFSKFGGTSSVAMRSVFRSAERDESVKGILLHIDSPGGTVAGTQELANDVAAFARDKPLSVHVSGMMASAAYWIGAWAPSISAEETAEIGSLGVYTVVHDTSEAYEAAGVKVHLISTGAHKGEGAEGIPVSESTIESIQEIVDDMNAIFMRDVSAARGFDVVEAGIADGRVFIASKALDHGLIDSVRSIDETYAELVGRTNQAKTTPVGNGSRARRAAARAQAAILRG